MARGAGCGHPGSPLWVLQVAPRGLLRPALLAFLPLRLKGWGRSWEELSETPVFCAGWGVFLLEKKEREGAEAVTLLGVSFRGLSRKQHA